VAIVAAALVVAALTPRVGTTRSHGSHGDRVVTGGSAGAV